MTIATKEFRKFINDLDKTYGGVKKRLMDRLRDESIKGAALVKMRMPVYSGRSKAGWAIYTQKDLLQAPPEGADYNTWVKRRAESTPDDAIWIENGQKMEIVQGTNVPEVEFLNEGWSLQAPAGFIDTVLDEITDSTEKAVLDELNQVLLGL